MEADPIATVDWYTYATAENGYMKVGNVENASIMLKKSENLVYRQTRRIVYESVQIVHAEIGNKDEVYRLWNRCKNFRNSLNSIYLCMISSLVKLDDIESAKKVLHERESGHTSYDIRISNMMINAYCKWGLVDKAEAYIMKPLDNGRVLDGSTWDCMLSAYYNDNDVEKAVQTLKQSMFLVAQVVNINYPMLFELRNNVAERVCHCGVLEFILEEGMIYLPYWLLENMLILQEGDIMRVKNVTLSKGTYYKLQPHTKDVFGYFQSKGYLRN